MQRDTGEDAVDATQVCQKSTLAFQGHIPICQPWDSDERAACSTASVCEHVTMHVPHAHNQREISRGHTSDGRYLVWRFVGPLGCIPWVGGMRCEDL